MNTFQINNVLNIAKVFAIISVIMAHSRNVNYPFISVITERIGAIGVITFLIISGYYFNIEKYGFKLFFKNKIKTILIPWLFTGTIIYLVGLKFNFIDWLLWIFGYKTYLYYLTIIMSCYLIFSYFNSKKWLFIFIGLNCISLFATSFGLIDFFGQQFIKDFELYNYFNIFNWIGFFSIGMLLKTKMEKLLHLLSKQVLVIVVFYLGCLLFSVFLESENAGYFSKLAFPLEILGSLALFSLATLKVFDKKRMYQIASFTFAIYLVHFLVFPARKILISNIFTEFINPVLLMLIAYFLLNFALYLSTIFKLNSYCCLLLGIRNNN